MNILKKALGLSLVGVLALTSCNLIVYDTSTTKPTAPSFTAVTNPEEFHAKLKNSKTQISKELTPSYQEGDFDKAKENMKKAEKIMDENGSFSEFKEIYNEILKFINVTQQDVTICYAYYSTYGDEETMNKYLEYNEYYLTAFEWYDNIRHKMAKHAFKSDFFPGMTDKEIEESIGKEKSEKYYDLYKKIDKLQTEHSAYSDEEVMSKGPKLYAELVGYQNELAKEEGYDNYLEYAYENVYGRDYTYQDTDEFFNNVSKYIWPEYKNLEDNLYSAKQSLKRTNNDEYELVKNIFVFESFECNMNYFDDYAYYMSDNFYKQYKHLWSGEGYYFVSHEDDGFEGAFTDYFYRIGEPYVYIGPGYDNLFTLVHEFGHYYAFTEYSGITSYDIAETQSQGNELLFLEYFLKNNNLSDLAKNVFRLNRDQDAYWTIMIASLVNEFEKLVYTQENLKASDLDMLMKKAYEKMGGYNKVKDYVNLDGYWQFVCVTSQVYYISYATSLIASKELQTVAKEDLNKAKEAYYKLCKADFDKMIFIDVLEYAGLSNPFTEEAFKSIVA